MFLREGFSDLNELKAVYQDKIRKNQDQNQRQDPIASCSTTVGSKNPESTSFTPNPNNPHLTTTTNPPGLKPLSSYINIPKTLLLPPAEIEYIWRLRHSSDPQSLCAVIPYPTYSHIAQTARLHPRFILPIPRPTEGAAESQGQGQGAEIHFLQWTFPTPTMSTVLFTHLAEFKLRGEFSQPHTTVTHHLDLAESKGLVLLQGSVMEGRGVTVEEGKWLVMCLQKFYGAGLEGGREREQEQEQEVGRKRRRRKLLEQFNRGDGGFRVDELLDEAEKIV